MTAQLLAALDTTHIAAILAEHLPGIGIRHLVAAFSFQKKMMHSLRVHWSCAVVRLAQPIVENRSLHSLSRDIFLCRISIRLLSLYTLPFCHSSFRTECRFCRL